MHKESRGQASQLITLGFRLPIWKKRGCSTVKVYLRPLQHGLADTAEDHVYHHYLGELIGSCGCVSLACDLKFTFSHLWFFECVSDRKLDLDFIDEPMGWWKSLLNYHMFLTISQ